MKLRGTAPLGLVLKTLCIFSKNNNNNNNNIIMHLSCAIYLDKPIPRRKNMKHNMTTNIINRVTSKTINPKAI